MAQGSRLGVFATLPVGDDETLADDFPKDRKY